MLRDKYGIWFQLFKEDPVRVIHGFKIEKSGEDGQSKDNRTSTFTYDGLYTVMDFWQDHPKGSTIFKILRKPHLILHAVKTTRESKEDNLCIPNVCQGSERIPICVVNTIIDGIKPTLFKHITKLIYPSQYKKELPKSCDCTNGWSKSNNCICAVKNGGKLPFNYNGAIIWAKPLVYEASEKDLGIRSLVLSLLVVSYASILVTYCKIKKLKKKMMHIHFDIGCNYGDTNFWKGLKLINTGL
ncbi:hypothetical protein EJB05_05944, partial [Eragrostis curvula]